MLKTKPKAPSLEVTSQSAFLLTGPPHPGHSRPAKTLPQGPCASKSFDRRTLREDSENLSERRAPRPCQARAYSDRSMMSFCDSGHSSTKKAL